MATGSCQASNKNEIMLNISQSKQMIHISGLQDIFSQKQINKTKIIYFFVVRNIQQMKIHSKNLTKLTSRYFFLFFLCIGGVSGGINPCATARTNSCLFRLAKAEVCTITVLGVRR